MEEPRLLKEHYKYPGLHINRSQRGLLLAAPRIRFRKILFITLLIFALTIRGGPLTGFISFTDMALADPPIPLGATIYHSYNETVTELNQIAADHPAITKLISIGKSYEGRDIWALKVSDNPEIEEDEPEVFFDGNHHAREWLTIEVCLYILNYLTDNYGINATITNIVDNRQIWVVPCVNPDGREYDSPGDDPTDHHPNDFGRGWRKNRRDNGGSYGVDLNRNYGYMWGGAGASDVPSSGTHRGKEAFSENETRAIRDFVKQHDFVFAISYHSYYQLILYPWGYTYNSSEDDALFKAVAEDMANLITNKAGSAFPGYDPQQGSDLYMTSGTTDDWLYGEMGVYAFCIELYPDFWDNDANVSSPYDSFHPNADKVIPVCEDNIEAALYLALIADNPFQVFDYHVSLSAPVKTMLINQSETETFTVTVTNDGSNDEFYDLTVSSIPGWTIDIAPSTMFLFSEFSWPAMVTVTVPGGEAGGYYNIWVNAISQTNSSVTASLLLKVQVPYFNDVGIQSIDTFTDGGTYLIGNYAIKSTAKNFGRNDQPEFNVSLEIRKLGPPITQTVFSDDMESGINGWQVIDLDGSISQSSWKQVTSSSNSPTTSWWCGDTKIYTNKTAQLLISPSFSLKWALNANLSFYHKYKTESNYDYCSVDLSNGTKWTTLVTYDGNGPSSFEKVVISLKDFIGSDDVRIRFRFTSDEFKIDDGWYIDDVIVSAEFPSETTVYGPVKNQTTGIMAQDDIQQIGWDYTFTQIGDYKIYVTTLLETDEWDKNNQSIIRIRIDPSPGTYTILKQGWNLISIPLIQSNTSLSSVLESIQGKYDAIQWYDITDPNDPWKHNKAGKPFGNDLFEINETIGFWIHITQPGDTIFLYNGTQPIVNQTVILHEGWNLVGYPSLKGYDRTDGLNDINFPTEVDAILSYNASTQKWEELGPTDHFEIGRGYWIHAKQKCTWEVPL